MKDIKCIHVDLKKYKDRSIYIYNLSNKQDIILCPDCNMNLAGEIMKQLATEVFLDKDCGCWNNKAMKILDDELNMKEVENGRTKRRSKKTRGKKSKD